MESRGDRESELQQLVSSDGDNEDSIVQDDTDNTVTEIKVISPVRSNKVVNKTIQSIKIDKLTVSGRSPHQVIQVTAQHPNSIEII